MTATAQKSPTEFRQIVGRIVDGLPPGGTLLDVGGNVGKVTEAVVRARPGATVHLFEPVPRFAERARKRLAEFAGVTVNVVGLSDAAGEADIYTEPGNPGWSTLDPACATPEKTVTHVALMRLDDYPLERLDVIKLDVEHWEGKVLKGGRRTIDRFVPAIVSELSRGSEDIWYERVGEMERLFDIGYKRIDYRVKGRTNVIFEPPRGHAE